MRKVVEVKYETILKSDVSESNIYAFRDGSDISFLCRKNNRFYWKPLGATNMVWYKESDTIEEAIESLLKEEDYKRRGSPPIMEFYATREFIKWAYKELC